MHTHTFYVEYMVSNKSIIGKGEGVRVESYTETRYWAREKLND